MDLLRSSDLLGLRLEHDPGAEKEYRVVADGTVVYATNVETSALLEYEDLYRERDKPYAEVRRREHDFKIGERLQSERFTRTSIRAAKATGGKGGRGGV